jgi:hypothetical protein
MAARPLDSDCTATMIRPCQKNMLNTASTNNSHQCLRSMRNGTFMAHKASPSTGVPSHMHSIRKVSGGKPVTPIFMTGQLMPHTKVSKTRTVHWRVESLCMAGILARPFKISA